MNIGNIVYTLLAAWDRIYPWDVFIALLLAGGMLFHRSAKMRGVLCRVLNLAWLLLLVPAILLCVLLIFDSF